MSSDEQRIFNTTSAATVPRVAGAVKKSFITKMSNNVAYHPSLSFAIIVILTILLIGMYVYYHGLFMIGPYMGKTKKTKKRKDEEESFKLEKEPSKLEDSSSLETETLIKKINQD